MQVYLVRHTAVDVPAGIAYGQTDVPLKDSFETEAEKTLKALENLRFDRVFSSPLSRCTRLAARCGYPDAIPDERLKELSFGDWEMKSWKEVSADPYSEQWFGDWLHVPAHNGESFMQLYKRVFDFMEELLRQDLQQVCVFAHGGTIAAACVYAGECLPQEAFTQVPPYGAVVSIKIRR